VERTNTSIKPNKYESPVNITLVPEEKIGSKHKNKKHVFAPTPDSSEKPASNNTGDEKTPDYPSTKH
jgi:hypothetical protein